MQENWKLVTIGTSPIRLETAKTNVCKLSVQSAPGNRGNIKIGGANMTTADVASPGSFISPSVDINPDSSIKAGVIWKLETQTDSNTIDVSAYYIHGTNPGDVAMVSYSTA
jgi:hypothetical protein